MGAALCFPEFGSAIPAGRSGLLAPLLQTLVCSDVLFQQRCVAGGNAWQWLCDVMDRPSCQARSSGSLLHCPGDTELGRPRPARHGCWVGISSGQPLPGRGRPMGWAPTQEPTGAGAGSGAGPIPAPGPQEGWVKRRRAQSAGGCIVRGARLRASSALQLCLATESQNAMGGKGPLEVT